MDELARLGAGGRTDTLEKKLRARLAKAIAADLLEQYNKQQDLDLDGDPEDLPGRGGSRK